MIQTNLGGGKTDDYCEECGWPDENRGGDRSGKHYGYNCAVCNEPIKEPQATEHTADGLAHFKCCRPNEKGHR